MDNATPLGEGYLLRKKLGVKKHILRGNKEYLIITLWFQILEGENCNSKDKHDRIDMHEVILIYFETYHFYLFNLKEEKSHFLIKIEEK